MNSELINFFFTLTRLFNLLLKNETVILKNLSAKFGTLIKYDALCLIGIEFCEHELKKITVEGFVMFNL